MVKYNFSTHIFQPQRVDIYLSALFSQFSRSYIQKLIDTGHVRVNGNTVTKNLKIQPRDEFSVEILIEPNELLAQDIPLDIMYEDENILIINKDAGINTHPVPGIEGKKGTLVNAILYHCREKLPTINGQQRPGIVHRLDKDTSWVIMIAKTDEMMQYLSETIKNRQVKKYYIAIVSGRIQDKKFTIESQIGRHETDRTRMTTKNPLNPKRAITHGEVQGYIDDMYTVVKIDLETGRTHQIRVHLAELWYPIIWDTTYGDTVVNTQVRKKYWLQRQALHAQEVIVELYGEQKSFFAPIKPDISTILAHSI